MLHSAGRPVPAAASALDHGGSRAHCGPATERPGPCLGCRAATRAQGHGKPSCCANRGPMCVHQLKNRFLSAPKRRSRCLGGFVGRPGLVPRLPGFGWFELFIPCGPFGIQSSNSRPESRVSHSARNALFYSILCAAEREHGYCSTCNAFDVHAAF